MNAVGYAIKEPVAETTDDSRDMDALQILPLRVLPFRNEKIGRARLIKNSRLAGVLEVYATRETGSGQVPIERLPEFYGIRDPLNDPDMRMILKLGPVAVLRRL
ncbi:MAG: hypothetical protein FJX59_13965 [Alphaproteobacteria bacterium]|nr:hypothetical protein [Alphaproteobacteria bacterium]